MNVPLTLASLLTGSFESFMQGLVGAAPADAVQEPALLEDYLHRTRGLATWHIDLLVRNARISVLRGGTRIVAPMWDFALNIGDRVTWDESSPAFQSAYKAVPAKTYAMVAPHDPNDTHLGNMAAILARRGAIELSAFDPTETVIQTLSEFVQHVNSDHRVVGPIRDLVIASHAHWGGQLNFGTDVMQDTPSRLTSFESVDSAGSQLRIPDDAFEPRPGTDRGRRIVFMGCDAGDAKPLMQRLRQAINPSTAVVAPKHWMGSARVGDSGDLIEFMGVAHMVLSPVLLTRVKLIGRLQAMGASDANDAPIPPTSWDGWLPAMDDVPQNMGWVRQKSIEVKLPEVRWTGHTLPIVSSFILERGLRLYHWRVKFPLVAGIRTSLNEAQFNTDKVQALKDTLSALPDDPRDPFSRVHPFPWWERFRFKPPATRTRAQVKAARERWIDAFTLDLRWEIDSAGQAYIRASHDEPSGQLYVLVVPALDPNDFLYVNYYPDVANAPQPARDDLAYTRSRFWLSV